MQVGKMAGIQLKINNWLIPLILLFTVCGLGTKMMLAFTAVLCHELAHVWAAYMLGLSIREIELLPFGGVAYIDRLNEAGSNKEIVIAAAGPTVSLVLAAVLSWMLPIFPLWEELLEFCFEINIMLALFNLLPALPLDGSRILRSLLCHHINYEQAAALVINLTKIISSLLCIKVIYDYIFLSSLNLTFCLAAVFLYSSANAEAKITAYRRMSVLSGKKARLMLKKIMPTMHYTALSTMCVQDILRLFGPNHYYIIIVIDEKSKIQGTLTETEIWEGTAVKGIHAKIGQFLD